MKLLVSILASAALAAVCLAAEPSGQQQPVALNNKPAPQPANGERQGRQIGSDGSNQLGDSSSNNIEHSTQFKKFDKTLNTVDARQAIEQFMSPLNILKTLVNLFFGKEDEIKSTSRSVLGVLSSALDLLKAKLKSRMGPNAKARSAGASNRVGLDDISAAGVSMIQGYVKSVMTNDLDCTKRYLCEANRQAMRDAKEFGYLISTVGGYATAYLLSPVKGQHEMSFIQDAMRTGRNVKEGAPECHAVYKCKEMPAVKPNEPQAPASPTNS